MLYALRDIEYKSSAMNPPVTDDYGIWGKPGGAFRLGVLGVLMGRSGYLQHKK
jgi:hypothetical protein